MPHDPASSDGPAYSRREWISQSSGWLAAAVGGSHALGQDAPSVGTVTSLQVAAGLRGAAATVHPLATDAAIRMLQQGGNAADAAVAAAVMLSVVDGHNSGLGGGCFVLARSADGTVLAIDGRETAPAGATRTMFLRGGVPDVSLSQTGALASGVPGAVAAYHRLSSAMGTGRWKEAVEWAADVAEAGFVLPRSYANRLASVADELRQFAASREIFLHADGTPLAAGETLRQADLAKTLRELASGPEAFYRGRFADLLDRWMRRHDGVMRREDLAAYRPLEREPIRSEFREHQVLGFPPPSSGGIHVAQILAMLERYDLASIIEDRPTLYYHLVAQAMRLAFADRAKWLGDPDYADVPRGLLDADYLRRRGELIRESKALADVEAGMPPGATEDLFPKLERHTTHLSVADAAGNWVAITATVNTTLGSKVVIPETGIVMNNEMDDFAIAPGIPNAFGLIGQESNAPEAGKRPLSSMSPTIVLRGGEPVLSCGAAGGPRIISATVQNVLRVISLGQEIGTAIAAPRIHHQWRPNVLLVETRLADEIRDELRELGHVVETTSAVATAQAITRSPGGLLTAASEPRVESTRAGAY